MTSKSDHVSDYMCHLLITIWGVIGQFCCKFNLVWLFLCFLMLNYLTDDAEHCSFGGYNKKKNSFYSRAITQPKIIQPEKSLKGHNSDKNQWTEKCWWYANSDLIPTTPVKFG